MTPRQLLALRRRRIEQMQWLELMFSRLTAAVCNFGFSRPETPIEETAFMIHPLKQEAVATPQEPPGDALMRLLEKLPPGAAYRM
jgi:hypothetical protein